MLPHASTAANGRGPGQVSWEDRAGILGGARQFTSGGGRLEKIDFAGTKIALHGGLAVVTSTSTTITRTGEGTDTHRGRATEVFVREGQRWVKPFWYLEPFAVRNGREIPLPDTLERFLREKGRVTLFDGDLLEALCDVLDKEPGELLEREKGKQRGRK